MDEANVDPEQWLEEYGDTLYRYAFLHCNDRETAEDLVQDTFIAALRSFSSYKGGSSLRTWLIGILKHKLMDHYRRQNREYCLTDWEQEDGQSVEDIFFKHGHWRKPVWIPLSPKQELQENEFWLVLHNCIQKLPQTMNQIFSLRMLDDVPIEDLCKNLELTATNVSVILYRARLLMRDCLKKNWFDSASEAET